MVVCPVAAPRRRTRRSNLGILLFAYGTRMTMCMDRACHSVPAQRGLAANFPRYYGCGHNCRLLTSQTARLKDRRMLGRRGLEGFAEFTRALIWPILPWRPTTVLKDRYILYASLDVLLAGRKWTQMCRTTLLQQHWFHKPDPISPRVYPWPNSPKLGWVSIGPVRSGI